MRSYNVNAHALGSAVQITSLGEAKRRARGRARGIVGRIAVYGPWEHRGIHESGNDRKIVERKLFWTSTRAAYNDDGARAAGEIQRITVEVLRA